MKRILTILTPICLFASLLGGCSDSNSPQKSSLTTEQDSVAYVLGMNIARTLREVDSTLNIEAVCAGMREHFAQNERFSMAEAERIYLHYLYVSKPEAVLAYEDRYLEEICEENRSYARSKSGLTYAVEVVGDEKFAPKNISDTVSFRYMARTLDGREFDSSYTRGDTTRVALGELSKGLQESLKLIGKGGRINAYLPAALAFGAEGNAELGVEPNATLYYEIELLNTERAEKRRLNTRTSIDL